MKASKFFSPLLVGLLMGWFLCQPAPVFAVVATGAGGGTTLTESASLRSALSDETGTGVAVFGTTPSFTTSAQFPDGSATVPAIGFTSDVDGTGTGFYRTGANAIGVTTNGTLRATFDSGGRILMPESTASAPWLASSSSTNTGYYVRSLAPCASVGGTEVYAIGTSGFIVKDTMYQGWTQASTDPSQSVPDLRLYRDAAGTLALRNGTTPHAIGIYNTYTSSTNQEKYQTAWSSNVCYTGTKAGSTSGSNRLEVHHGGAEKTLTESSATAFAQVAVASGASVAGRVDYQICADDSTDFQSRTGSVNFSLVNKAGTETAGLGTVLNESVAASSGTLTVSFDTDTSPTNAVNIRANAVSSLTQTTLKIIYRVELFGPQVTVTPQ